ncbi:type II secretion system protein [Eubacteriaceae bacterium ES2]|nr:type II secretion system protein [Eubacteriaceae bacterium ES2]
MKADQKGSTLIEVILTLMLIGMVFSVILPAFFLTHKLENTTLVNRRTAAVERMMTLYFKKQVYETDVIYQRGSLVYLRDLETANYYDRYNQNSQLVMRYKYALTSDGNLVSIGSGGNSQFETGFKIFSIVICPEDQRFLIITYQLLDEDQVHEIYIEHGKEIKTLP